MMRKLLVFLVILGMLSMVAALDTTTQLFDVGSADASISSVEANSNPNSALLQADLITDGTNEGRVRINLPEDFTLGDLDSISWEQYVMEGYIAHVDVILDDECDGSEDDAIVFEYDKVEDGNGDGIPENANYATGEWVSTFDDNGEEVNDDSYGWLSSGAAGNEIGDPDYVVGSLADWKDGDVTGGEQYDSNTCVPAIEIEIDGWIETSEAYIDDININGNEIEEDFEENQEVTGTVADFVTITVEPATLDFGTIPYGTDITDMGEEDVVINSAGSSTTGGDISVVVSITGDPDNFYTALLEFDVDGEGSWTKVATSPSLMVPSGSSASFENRLRGNTATFGAGTKTAVLTYTAFGPTP